MNIVTEQNAELHKSLIRVRNIVADPKEADPMIGIMKDPVRFGILKTMQRVLEQNPEKFSETLAQLPTHLEALAGRVRVASITLTRLAEQKAQKAAS